MQVSQVGVQKVEVTFLQVLKVELLKVLMLLPSSQFLAKLPGLSLLHDDSLLLDVLKMRHDDALHAGDVLKVAVVEVVLNLGVRHGGEVGLPREPPGKEEDELPTEVSGSTPVAVALVVPQCNWASPQPHALCLTRIGVFEQNAVWQLDDLLLVTCFITAGVGVARHGGERRMF